MLKTQRFSSLFRHYAKYHGLRKDDLEYYFVNALENEDTPESVQLQRGDTIMVRKKRKVEPMQSASDGDEEFVKDMRELLDDEEHMDAVFVVRLKSSQSTHQHQHQQQQQHFKTPEKVGSSTSNIHANTGNASNSNVNTNTNTLLPMKVGSEDSIKHHNTTNTIIKNENETNLEDSTNTSTSAHTANTTTNTTNTSSASTLNSSNNNNNNNTIEIPAHKCILTARGEYFKAHFRKSASSEQTITFSPASKDIIHVDSQFTDKTIRLMLEFIYTNRIRSISSVSTNDLMLLLHLSDLWLLRDLKRLVEHELIQSHMDVNTVARMYCATEDYHAQRLARACITYIMDNIREVTGNVTFQEEMKHYPNLTIPILRAAADLIPEQPSHKKQRTGDHGSSGGGSGGPVVERTPSAALSSQVPDTDA